MKIDDIKRTAKDLVAKDLIKSFDFLTQVLSAESEVYDELTFVQGKWRHLNKDFDKGLIARADFSVELSKILSSIIDMVNGIDKEDLADTHEGTTVEYSSKIFNEKGKKITLLVREENQEAKRIEVYENDKCTKILEAYFLQYSSMKFPRLEGSAVLYLPILERVKKLILSTFTIAVEGIRDGDVILIERYDSERLEKPIDKSNPPLSSREIHDLKSPYYSFNELFFLFNHSSKILFRVSLIEGMYYPFSQLEILFKIRSFTGINNDFSPIIGNEHRYVIKKSSECFETNIWHPNIGSDGNISMLSESGDFIVTHSPSLPGKIMYTAKLLQYKFYHAEDIPPYPLNPEAAKWVKEHAVPHEIINKDRGIYTDYSFLLA